jgi:hypothetical protein
MAYTVEDATVRAPHTGGTGYATWQSFTDVSGDGRPDLVFRRDGQLWVAGNHAGRDGTTILGPTPPGGFPDVWPLVDDTFTHGAFETRTAITRRFTYDPSNVDYVWRQAIDVNGDGRIDILDAAEDPHHWVVYLNTPSSHFDSGVKWERRSFAVTTLRDHLTSRGHTVVGDFVPLAKRFTGRDREYRVCLECNGATCIEVPEEGWAERGCGAGVPVNTSYPEQTFTEWEVTDLNGDGYSDVVFNPSPVAFVDDPRDLPGPPGGVVRRRHSHIQLRDDDETSDVKTILQRPWCAVRHRRQPLLGAGDGAGPRTSR